MRFIIVIMLLFIVVLEAKMIEYGYASSEELSKQKALENLSKKLEVMARKKGYAPDIYDLDKLPVLAPDYFIRIYRDYYETRIELAKNSLPLYKKRLNELTKEMHLLKESVESIVDEPLRLDMYQKLFSLYTMIDRYNTVLNLVYDMQEKLHTKERRFLQRQMLKLATEIDSKQYALERISGYFKQNRTFCFPLTVFSSQTPSEYGIDFMRKLKKEIHPTNNFSLARYILIGRYDFAENRVVLQLMLLEKKSFDIVRVKTIAFKDDNIRRQSTLPRNYKLEKVLFLGYDKNDFDLYIKSALGSSDLVFEKKKRAKFYLKTKRDGYLFVIGYYNLRQKNIAYLAQLRNAQGNAKFVKPVRRGGYNKIADFEVKPPLGTRSYQLFVVEQMPILPQTKYDPKYRLYTIQTKDLAAFAKKFHSYQLEQKKRYKSIAYSAITFVTLEPEE